MVLVKENNDLQGKEVKILTKLQNYFSLPRLGIAGEDMCLSKVASIRRII